MRFQDGRCRRTRSNSADLVNKEYLFYLGPAMLMFFCYFTSKTTFDCSTGCVNEHKHSMFQMQINFSLNSVQILQITVLDVCDKFNGYILGLSFQMLCVCENETFTAL